MTSMYSQKKMFLVHRLHLLTDSSHSDPCLPTRLDDPKWWSLPESSVGVVWSNQWSNHVKSVSKLLLFGRKWRPEEPLLYKTRQVVTRISSQPTWNTFSQPLFNDDQRLRLGLGPNYWSESWNSNEAINSLNLPDVKHTATHNKFPGASFICLIHLRDFEGVFRAKFTNKTPQNSM